MKVIYDPGPCREVLVLELCLPRDLPGPAPGSNATSTVAMSI